MNSNITRKSKIEKIIDFICWGIVFIYFIYAFGTVINEEYLDPKSKWDILFIDNISEVVSNTDDSARSFFNSNWGDSKEQVKQDNPQLELLDIGEGILTRNRIRLLGLNSLVLFHFGAEGLDYSLISIDEEYSDDNFYKKDYELVVDVLSSELGAPVSIVRSIEDIESEADKREYIDDGIIYETTWETDKSIIYLYLSKNDNQISHIMVFGDKEYDKDITGRLLV